MLLEGSSCSVRTKEDRHLEVLSTSNPSINTSDTPFPHPNKGKDWECGLRARGCSAAHSYKIKTQAERHTMSVEKLLPTSGEQTPRRHQSPSAPLVLPWAPWFSLRPRSWFSLRPCSWFSLRPPSSSLGEDTTEAECTGGHRQALGPAEGRCAQQTSGLQVTRASRTRRWSSTYI